MEGCQSIGDCRGRRVDFTTESTEDTEKRGIWGRG